MHTDNQVQNQSESLPQEAVETDLSRRKAVKLGIYAAYTAPVLLSLLTSNKAQAGSPPAPPDEP